MANITQRGNKYLIRIFLYTDKSKKKKYYSETFTPTKTRKRDIENEVLRHALDLEAKFKKSVVTEGRKMIFVHFVEEWKERYASNPEIMTEALRDSYYDLLVRKAVPIIGSLQMCDITSSDIDRIFEAMEKDGLSFGTRKRVLTAIRSVFRYAKTKAKVIDIDPSKEVELTRRKTEAKKTYNVFSEEQYTAFLNAIRHGFDLTNKATKRHLGVKVLDISSYQTHKEMNQQWIAFFSMAIYGGFRRGELLALTWNDIDFEKMIVNVHKSVAKRKNPDYIEGSDDHKEIQYVKEPKTESGIREVDLPDFVFDDIKQWRETQLKIMDDLGSKWLGFRGKDFDNNFVFIDCLTGNMMDIATPTHKIKSVITMYNSMHPDNPLPVLRLHDLRHTHVTDLIAKGTDPYDIAQRVGHKDVYVTLTTYAHYLKKKNDRKISMLYERKRAIV